MKHLHLPPAHSLPLQAVWVFCRQRARYLWTIINIQDRQLLWHTEMQCSLQVHKHHGKFVVWSRFLEVFYPHMCIWSPCSTTSRYFWIVANDAEQSEGVNWHNSSTSAWYVVHLRPQLTPHQRHLPSDRKSRTNDRKSANTSQPPPTVSVWRLPARCTDYLITHYLTMHFVKCSSNVLISLQMSSLESLQMRFMTTTTL